MTALSGLATFTQNVRVGCLVFCALFRNPGVLVKAGVIIDHLSGGRADIGIGAGWLEEEFREFGYGFPPLDKVRSIDLAARFADGFYMPYVSPEFAKDRLE